MKYLTDNVDKSQLTARNTERESHEWVDQASQRQVISTKRVMRTSPGLDEKGELTYAEFVGRNKDTGGLDDTYPLNQMPAGMDITNQDRSEQNSMRLISSMDSGTEGPLTQKDRDRGYKRGHQSMTEESKDHYQDFYDEAQGENDGGDKTTGFLERRNVLDRN